MILGVKLQKQILQNWCWAAVTSTVSFYYNDNEQGWKQPALAARLLKSSCGSITGVNAGEAPDVCNQQVDIVSALSLSGNLAGQLGRPLTMDEIISQINRSFPVCCQIRWPGFDGSHFVLLYGYNDSDTRLVIGDPDPERGGVFLVSYGELARDYREGGEWVRTIGTHAAIS